MVNWLKRRVLPLILAVAMLASYLPVSAFAEGDDPTDIWEVSCSDVPLSKSTISNHFGLSPLVDTFQILDANDTKVYDSTADWGQSVWNAVNGCLHDSEKSSTNLLAILEMGRC